MASPAAAAAATSNDHKKVYVKAKDFDPALIERSAALDKGKGRSQPYCPFHYNHPEKGRIRLADVVILNPIMRTPWGITTYNTATGKPMRGLGLDDETEDEGEHEPGAEDDEGAANGNGAPPAPSPAAAPANDAAAVAANGGIPKLPQFPKSSIVLSFDNRVAETLEFRQKLMQVDSDNIAHAHKHWTQWTQAKTGSKAVAAAKKPGKEASLDTITDKYNPIVKPSEDEKYAGTMRLPIAKTRDTGQPIIALVDKNKNKLTWKAFDEGAVLRAGWSMSGLWMGVGFKDFGVRSQGEILRLLDPKDYPVQYTGRVDSGALIDTMPDEEAAPPEEGEGGGLSAEQRAILDRKRKAEGEPIVE